MKPKTPRLPKPPKVSKELENTLYNEAYAFYHEAPWNTIHEEHIFAVQDPFSSSIGYCSIAGSGGECFGIALFRGEESLNIHLQLQNGQNHPENAEIISSHNALVLDFLPKNMLNKKELAILKRNPSAVPLDLFPSFLSYLPGFQGWHLTEEETSYFIFILQSARKYAEEIITPKPNPTKEKYTLYTRCQETGLPQSSWHTPKPIASQPSEPIPLNTKRIEGLKGLKLYHDGAWEASTFNTPNLICDKERPYFAKVSMIVHQESLLVLQVKAIEVHECPKKHLSEEILSCIEIHKRIPAEIFFNNKALYEALKPLAKTLGIQASLVDFLPATAPAQDSLLQYIR